MKVRTASRSTGGVAIMERSRTPVRASCRVRGIGVAESVRRDVRAELLQPLLVLDAEVLLLVDDQEPEVAELDAFAEQRMGADHDVDRAVP
jgi:hypothetical protein